MSGVTEDPRAAAGVLPVPSDEVCLDDWLARRSLPRVRLSPQELAARRTATVSVVVPAREVAATIGPIVDELLRFERAGAVDEVLVVDAASSDGTAALAERHGARVVQESDLLPETGPCRGKGDAMWRALSATEGELVVYLDGDTQDFGPRFLVGLLAALFDDSSLEFVKGTFARPFKTDKGEVIAHGGGRVTELMARPLLNLHCPALAGFTQPLAGEVAARRSLLEALPFPVGYGVETAMLLDAAATVGVEAMAQVDLGTRQNRHQSLRELSAMAYAVLVAGSRRVLGDEALEALSPGTIMLPGLEGADVDPRQVAVEERPPLRTLASGGHVGRT